MTSGSASGSSARTTSWLVADKRGRRPPFISAMPHREYPMAPPSGDRGGVGPFPSPLAPLDRMKGPLNLSRGLAPSPFAPPQLKLRRDARGGAPPPPLPFCALRCAATLRGTHAYVVCHPCTFYLGARGPGLFRGISPIPSIPWYVSAHEPLQSPSLGPAFCTCRPASQTEAHRVPAPLTSVSRVIECRSPAPRKCL